MISAFLVTFAAVALAELGDKTQLVVVAFAAKYRWRTVLLAVSAAGLVLMLLGALVGNLVAAVLPVVWIKLAAALAFIGFALWTVRGDHEEAHREGGGRSPFWTVAVAFFLAEMGDKTQIATVALAARYTDLVAVVVGTTAGMMLANVPVVLLGDQIAKRVSMQLVHAVAAFIFALLGVLTLLNVGRLF